MNDYEVKVSLEHWALTQVSERTFEMVLKEELKAVADVFRGERHRRLALATPAFAGSHIGAVGGE